MQSSSQGYRGYQGYPAVNPIVTDVPSIDPETAARWANLPRRPIQLPGPGGIPPGPSSTRPGGVHPGTSVGTSSQNPQPPPTSRDPECPKEDIDANPVVYIDLPEAGSQVSRSIGSPDEQELEFVQETIMYNPFENRRIDTPKEDIVWSSDQGAGYSGDTVLQSNTSPMQNRPNTLNIAASGSGSNPSSSRPTPNIPNFMTKESLVYGGDGTDGFPLSPIPISEFPRPPPAYTEVAFAQTPTPIDYRPAPQPPRTQVIVPDSNPVNPDSVINFDRKNLICHHCGVRVHTVVFREVGWLTHLIAVIVFVFFLPLVILVYVLDLFKYKNHYCPNCNQFIGYIKPVFGEKLHSVS